MLLSHKLSVLTSYKILKTILKNQFFWLYVFILESWEPVIAILILKMFRWFRMQLGTYKDFF